MTLTKSPSSNLSYFWKKKAMLSFIAVIFVIIIHNSAINQYLVEHDSFWHITNFLHTFFASALGGVAVPFFFFISGITFFRNYKPKLYVKKLTSRIKTLLIPYLIWNIIGLLFSVFYTYTPLSSYISGRELFNPSLPNILEGVFLYKYNFQFWFLYDLLFYILLTPIINLLINNKYLGFITCFLLLFLPLLTPSFLRVNTYFTIFYVTGCFIGKHYLHFFTKPTTQPIIIVSAIITTIILIIRILSLYNILPIPIIISQLLLFLLLFSTYFTSDFFIKHIKKTPEFIKESFPIYTLHTYFIAIIIKLIYLINPSSSIMLLLNEIASPIITTYLVIIISKLWHQKLPHSHQIAFGNR